LVYLSTAVGIGIQFILSFLSLSPSHHFSPSPHLLIHHLSQAPTTLSPFILKAPQQRQKKKKNNPEPVTSHQPSHECSMIQERKEQESFEVGKVQKTMRANVM
jgi:hypothetical protein